MTNKSHFRIVMIMFILTSLPFASRPVSALEIWTAHVEWAGYDFDRVTDCGDGRDNRCENYMKVKRTTSSSCSSTKTWIQGAEKYTYPGWDNLNPFYELTWSRVYGAPCLTFDVYIRENSAGAATSIHTFTISSSGSHSFTYLDLSIGSGSGKFKIEFWVTAVD